MIQLLFNALRLAGRDGACREALSDAERWRRDPLSHPALRRMSQAELADLPIGHPALPARLADRGC